MAAVLLGHRVGLSVVLSLIVVSRVQAQSSPSPSIQSLTAVSVKCPDAGCLQVSTVGFGTLGIQINGNAWTGTINFVGSLDGVAQVPLLCAQPTAPGLVNGTQLNGLWRCNVAGLAFAQVILTNSISGTPTVLMQPAPFAWTPPLPCTVPLGGPPRCS